MEIKLTKESAARMIKTCDALLASEPHSKNDKSLRELDAWIGVNIFGKKAIHKNGPRPTKGTEDDYFVIEYIHISHSLPHYTTDPAAAMEVMQKCYEYDRNSYFASFHNFLMRRKHDTSFTPEQVCLFARNLFSK